MGRKAPEFEGIGPFAGCRADHHVECGRCAKAKWSFGLNDWPAVAAGVLGANLTADFDLDVQVIDRRPCDRESADAGALGELEVESLGMPR